MAFRQKEEGSMKRSLTFSTLGVLALALGAQTGSVAVAGSNKARVRLNPAHAGNGTLATWARDAGEPGQKGDPNQFGLFLEHLLITTPDGPYAGTRNLLSRSLAAADLTKLAFDISGRSGEAGVFTPGDPRHGYCVGGAPRFVVEDDQGHSCLLECAQGAKVQDPDTNWWEISFVPPFSQYVSCTTGLSGMVTYIDITFDEGPASVVLDNIRVNGTVIGKPEGNGGDDNGGNDHDD
jgi:hypothetical protein